MTELLFHGLRQPRGQRRAPLSRQYEGRFGRIFRKLDPAPEWTEEQLIPLAESMREPAGQGQPGGWGSPGAPPPELDNPEIPSGYTYFGQFVDHDVTFDPVSRLQAKNDPDALHDFRSPRFDLDSLYGSGPQDEPFQYDRESNSLKFLLGANGNGEPDLPRNAQGTALIGDPRNDENIIVNQLQVAFLRLHNKLIDDVLADPTVPEERRFEAAQQQVRWHYQWIVVRDYLPRLVGGELMDQLWPAWDQHAPTPVEPGSDGAEAASAPKAPKFNLEFFRPKNNPFMPVEFSVAAFRFGHSQVRPAYHLNEVVRDVSIFLPGDPGPLGDLRGFRPLPDQWGVDWPLFFAIGGSEPQPSRRIDAKLSDGLFSLPGSDRSLALRNLLRGVALSLPSGQDVARALGLSPLTGADLGTELDPTPLWFYILKESELVGGNTLGPVGGRIVAEVLLGLLELDPHSWINQDPTWRPAVGTSSEGRLTLGDLLSFATS
jgi:hypothetical protein